MINNEFRLIGTIVSDFKVEETKQAFYIVEVEVERKNGGTNVYKIVCLPNNRNVDYNKSLKGKVVVIYGYVSVYKGVYDLVAQEINSVYDTKKEIEDSAMNFEKDG